MHDVPPDAHLIHDRHPDCICEPRLVDGVWVHHPLDGTRPARPALPAAS